MQPILLLRMVRQTVLLMAYLKALPEELHAERCATMALLRWQHRSRRSCGRLACCTASTRRAEVTVSSANEQRHMSLAEFLRAPFETALQRGEILTAVHIPSVPQNARWGYYKFCRMHGHFAETIAGVFLDPDRGASRAVIGATEARPTII